MLPIIPTVPINILKKLSEIEVLYISYHILAQLIEEMNNLLINFTEILYNLIII